MKSGIILSLKKEDIAFLKGCMTDLKAVCCAQEIRESREEKEMSVELV
jgi:hypothetical protein